MICLHRTKDILMRIFSENIKNNEWDLFIYYGGDNKKNSANYVDFIYILLTTELKQFGRRIV